MRSFRGAGVRSIALLILVLTVVWGTTAPAPTAAAVVPSLTVQSAQADVGQSASLTITLSDAATGLSGYDLTVSLVDPTVATIASTTLPGFGLVSQQALSASSVRLRAADLMRLIEVGAGQVLLATLTVDGRSLARLRLRSQSPAWTMTAGSLSVTRSWPVRRRF